MSEWDPERTVRNMRSAANSGEHAWRQLILDSYESLTTEVRALRKDVADQRIASERSMTRAKVVAIIADATVEIENRIDKVNMRFSLIAAGAGIALGFIANKVF